MQCLGFLIKMFYKKKTYFTHLRKNCKSGGCYYSQTVIGPQ